MGGHEQPSNEWSRRAVLAALGGAAATGLVTTEHVGAAAPEAVPAPTSGLSYRAYSVYDIRTATLASPTLSSGVATAPGGRLVLSLSLPAGVVVNEITLFARNATVTSFSGTIFRQDINGATIDVLSITIPANTEVNEPVTGRQFFTIEADSVYTLELDTSTSSRGLYAVRIGYVNVLSYMPVNPYRAFDSRPLVGRLTPGSRRLIDLGQNVNSSGVVVATGKIPASSRAVAVNITAVQATGANNFGVTAGDDIFPNLTSLVVFNAATPTIANAATVTCFNRQINMHTGSGPGSAHCVVDVLGYFI